MNAVHKSIRLTAALEKSLRSLAEQHDVTPYAMLQRSVKAGIAAQLNPPVADDGMRELVAEVASISTRLADVERMLDRTLFTACAAYCYARSAAKGGGKTDEVITAETNGAYDRQRATMEERP
jgi:predicted transcriptional regulator